MKHDKLLGSIIDAFKNWQQRGRNKKHRYNTRNKNTPNILPHSNTREHLFHTWKSFNSEENTVPTKLYWILFPIEDLRQAVETAKRVLTKEKLDRQLTGHTSSSPFMSIREGQNSRWVSFDNREEFNDKIDKLTVMIDRLAATDNRRTRQFKPQIHQNRGRGQNRGNKQRNYQNRYRSFQARQR